MAPQPEFTGACSPEGVQDCAVGEEADEPVSHGDLVEEGRLGLHNVSVRHPEELHEACIQGDTLVAFEDQPLVRPALSEVYGGRVVLTGQRGEKQVMRERFQNRKGSSLTSLPHSVQVKYADLL